MLPLLHCLAVATVAAAPCCPRRFIAAANCRHPPRCNCRCSAAAVAESPLPSPPYTFEDYWGQQLAVARHAAITATTPVAFVREPAARAAAGETLRRWATTRPPSTSPQAPSSLHQERPSDGEPGGDSGSGGGGESGKPLGPAAAGINVPSNFVGNYLPGPPRRLLVLVLSSS